ncbi:universal stress protein [Geodermatophilus sp. DF01-2]|uniref:universal stress protein n=1 Tax=Geodermatophilus sp. DF01-2 TaxID=2559610 RepID=UPI001ADDA7F8|nr:universal stress protein [Geodermatophilus sp. DF01_2]
MSIVLRYDESPGSRPALALAPEPALRFDESLVLVYGVEPPGGVGEEFQAHQLALAELGRTAVSHAVEEAEKGGARTVAEVPPRKPAQALVDAARRHDGRVIVAAPAARARCAAPSSARCRTSCCTSPVARCCACRRGSEPLLVDHRRVAARHTDVDSHPSMINRELRARPRPR